MAQSMIKKSVVSFGCVVIGVTRRSSSKTLLTAARPFSLKKEEAKLPAEEDVQKSVFVSQSTDIFTNLALESWLYQNFNFADHHIMMAWRNDPCVVIGRNQNPWLEANVAHLVGRDVPIARRNSGGGAVYHDRGNLNLTFFTPRSQYNRKYNLEIITRGLYREFGVKAEVNERKDIVVRKDYKQVSGTAAKLGHLSAYHHCTLLVNANKMELRQALAKHETGIATNATASVRSPVANLCEENGRVTVDTLQTAIGWEYLRTPAYHIEDGGKDLIAKQRGFQLINPTEQWFPGLDQIRDELINWNWRYGKTPTFTVSRSFTVPSDLFNKANVPSEPELLQINMKVEKGLICDVTLSIPPGFVDSGFHGDASVVTHLRGKRFTNEALTALQEALQKLGKQAEGEAFKLGEREQFVAKCFGQVVNTI